MRLPCCAMTGQFRPVGHVAEIKVLFMWEVDVVAQIRIRAVEPPLKIHMRRCRSIHNGGVVQVVLSCYTLFTSEWGWKSTSSFYTEDIFCTGCGSKDHHCLCSECVIHMMFYILYMSSCRGTSRLVSCGLVVRRWAKMVTKLLLSEVWWNSSMKGDDGRYLGFSSIFG